jgi:hypothetical protein
MKVGKELLIIYEASDKWNRVVIVSKSHRKTKQTNKKIDKRYDAIDVY